MRILMPRFWGLVLLLLLPLASFAAILPTSRVPVSVGATPAYQKANQIVVVRAYASVPKGLYTYSWTVNGNLAGEDIDLEEITVSSGNPGSRTVVNVSVIDVDGVTRGEAEYVIRPAGVDLVWEGATYVPPFYNGKRYANTESPILVEAIPHMVENGVPIPRQSLVYTWEVDGKLIREASGYGKTILKTLPSRLKRETPISVTVSTPDGRLAAKQNVAIPHVTPHLAVYEIKPLVGTFYERAVIGTRNFAGEEMAFRTVPFFISEENDLAYSWFLNNEPFSLSGNDPSVAVFRKTGDGTGVFTVKVRAEKEGSVFEKGAASFGLSFEE